MLIDIVLSHVVGIFLLFFMALKYVLPLNILHLAVNIDTFEKPYLYY